MASSHQQTVKVGRQNGLEAEILEGLSEGDKVVLHPSDQIRGRREGSAAVAAWLSSRSAGMH